MALRSRSWPAEPSMQAYSRTPHPDRREKMPRVSLNQVAPDFSLIDYCGNTVRLAGFRGIRNVLLVFNRTFT